jgi:hypothetical protein
MFFFFLGDQRLSFIYFFCLKYIYIYIFFMSFAFYMKYFELYLEIF